VLRREEMRDRIEASARRVRELLETHAKRVDAGATHTVDGVSVTVDSKLQLTHVHIDDAAFDISKRSMLERAVVEAVNAATRQVVKSSSHALAELHSSEDWKSAMGEILGTKGRVEHGRHTQDK
jgi:DNA-binding protein YbaB